METQYFCFFNTYLKKFSRLSNEQLGELVRAAAVYNIDGQITEVDDSIALAFDVLRCDIDQSKERYAKLCETNSKNRRKALDCQKNNNVRPSAKKDNDRDDGQRSSRPSTIVTTVNDRDEIKIKSKEKSKSKENENKKESPLSPKKDGADGPGAPAPAPPASPNENLTIPENWDPVLREATDSWLRYKCERRESYKPTGLRTLFARIEEKAEQYGPKAVAEAIQDSISSGYKGILWDRLQKKQEPKKKTYTQSDYEAGEDFLSDVARRDSS